MNTKTKTIFIAGATDGIGMCLLREIAKDSSYTKVYALGRNIENIADIKDERLVILKCDITDQSQVSDALSSIDSKIDVFVSTIGTFKKISIAEIRPEDVREHFDLNVIANINFLLAVLPILNPNFAQVMVCLATLALRAKTNALQSATKVAYKYFLDILRIEYKDKVRVVTVFPPSVKTDIFKKSGYSKDLTNYLDPILVAQRMISSLNDIHTPNEIVEFNEQLT